MRIFKHYGHWVSEKAERFLPPHKNDGLELVFVANGDVRWDYAGVEVHTPAGHISFSWPWEIHGARNVRLPSVEFYWVLLPLKIAAPKTSKAYQLSAGLGLSVAERATVINKIREQDSHVFKATPGFQRCFPELVRALIRNDGECGLDVRGLYLLSMGELLKSTDAHLADDEADLVGRVQFYWETVMPKKLDLEISLEEMAVNCEMGRTSFSNITKKIYGESPMRLLTRKRIELAVNLLRSSHESITTIAFNCGFNSSQHFATVFKAYMKMTPSECRR